MDSAERSSIAEEALQELLEVAPQVHAAIVADSGGTPLAASLGPAAPGAAGQDLAKLLVRLLDEAERARTELGREPVTQLEVSTGTGHVFLVRGGDVIVAAITGTEPTVGLVFYDLKTALRSMREKGAIGESAAAADAAGSDAAVPASGDATREGAGA